MGIVPSGFASMNCKIWEIIHESISLVLQQLSKKIQIYEKKGCLLSPLRETRGGENKSCIFVAILNTINSQIRDPKLSTGSSSGPPISFWRRALSEKRGWLSPGGGATSEVNSVARFHSKPKSMRAYFPLQHCPLWRVRDWFPSCSLIRVRGEGQDNRDPPC